MIKQYFAEYLNKFVSDVVDGVIVLGIGLCHHTLDVARY